MTWRPDPEGINLITDLSWRVDVHAQSNISMIFLVTLYDIDIHFVLHVVDTLGSFKLVTQ